MGSVKVEMANLGTISRNVALTKIEQLDNNRSNRKSRSGVFVGLGCHNRIPPFLVRALFVASGWLPSGCVLT